MIVIGKMPLFLEVIEQSKAFDQCGVRGNDVKQRAKVLQITRDRCGGGTLQHLGPLHHLLRKLRNLPMRPRTPNLVLNLLMTRADQMTCKELGQIMKHRIVRRTDPAAEIDIPRAASPRGRKLVRVAEKTVGANHRMRIWAELLR